MRARLARRQKCPTDNRVSRTIFGKCLRIQLFAPHSIMSVNAADRGRLINVSVCIRTRQKAVRICIWRRIRLNFVTPRLTIGQLISIMWFENGSIKYLLLRPRLYLRSRLNLKPYIGNIHCPEHPDHL